MIADVLSTTYIEFNLKTDHIGGVFLQKLLMVKIFEVCIDCPCARTVQVFYSALGIWCETHCIHYASIPSRLAIGPAPTSISSASDSEPAFITNLDALRSDNPPHRHWPSRLLNDAADLCYSSCLALRLSLSIGLEEVDIQIPDYKRWTAAVKEVDTFGGMIRQCW